MGKYEITWDEYELWMINLDKDNREYNKSVPTKEDDLADAVLSQLPHTRHDIWNG